MLKTNTKKVIERVKKHILDYYENQKNCLIRDGQAVGGATLYHQGRNLAEGGAFLCYYWNQREFLRETLEETEKESGKYTDDQVFDLYCHLIGRAFEKIASEK